MTADDSQERDTEADEQDYSPLEPLPIVRALLLLLIRDNPESTGYDLIGLTEELTEGRALLQSGTVYGELRRLENHGMLSSQRETGGRRRREYHITQQGEEELATLMQQVQIRIESVLNPLLARYSSEGPTE